jgi:hypothetical protein
MFRSFKLATALLLGLAFALAGDATANAGGRANYGSHGQKHPSCKSHGCKQHATKPCKKRSKKPCKPCSRGPSYQSYLSPGSGYPGGYGGQGTRGQLPRAVSKLRNDIEKAKQTPAASGLRNQLDKARQNRGAGSTPPPSVDPAGNPGVEPGAGTGSEDDEEEDDGDGE